jgi:hypothetical protein
MAENPEQSELVPENEATIAEKAPDNEPPAPEPKKRGRPAGAKDKAPRKPRTRIIEEPPTPPPPPPAPPAAPPKAARAAKPREERPEPKAPEPAEMSPRTMFRVASAHIASLQSERENARRQYWQDAIARTLR